MNWGDSRLPDRFWQLVMPEPMSGCWLWMGGFDVYGRYYIKRVMHRPHRVVYEALVGEIPKNRIIDHRCRNKACCNPAHLRLATHSQNHQNVIAPRSNTSGYKGVYLNRSTNRWCAMIRANRPKKIYLGYYETPEDAARAYDGAARELHREFACLNFPDQKDNHHGTR